MRVALQCLHYTRAVWNFLLDILFPRTCFGCGKWGSYVCPNCASSKIAYFTTQVCPYCERPSLHGLTHPGCEESQYLDGMFVLAHYKKLIPEIIHQIKYQGVYATSKEIANLILQNYDHSFHFDYFVPVPLSKKRELTRGFNQAEKLAKALRFKPVVNLLIRTKDTKPQFELSVTERKKNVKNVFALNPNLLTHSLSNLSFCLIDDVATTGSTLFECAKVLKNSGAKKVYAICIARGG